MDVVNLYLAKIRILSDKIMSFAVDMIKNLFIPSIIYTKAGSGISYVFIVWSFRSIHRLPDWARLPAVPGSVPFPCG